MAKKINTPKTPKKMRVTFTLQGSPAKRRSMYRWFRALEGDGTLGVNMEAHYETETAFTSPEDLARFYNMKPEDFEETG